MPVLAEMYIRAKDLRAIPLWHRPAFRTKLESAASLVAWAAEALEFLDKTLWVVVDGGYAKRPFLLACQAARVVVVGRLRCDAALGNLPARAPAGQRGRGQPRKYGKHKLSLTRRAGQGRGWKRVRVTLYGRGELKRIKTFLATWKPVGGAMRVVLVREEEGWRAFFCTDVNASAEMILEAVGQRNAIAQTFHDLKEVQGTGQQQLRNYHANLAAWNLHLWLFTLVEVWAWDRPAETLCDRSAAPWDDAHRRPSHADRLRALRREILHQEYSQAVGSAAPPRKIRRLIEHLMTLAT